MPTEVRKVGSKWVVREKGGGKIKSRHSSRKKAEASQRIRAQARRKKRK
jgi:hypothetical protein